MARSVSLPMYDFPEVRDSTNKLLAALVDALSSCGEIVQAETPDSPTHEELMKMWRSNNTALSQSCGLPFVEELHDFVDVVGTFLWTDVSDERGQYQTVIVARGALGISSIAELGGLRPVVTNIQSLSGWCSLGVALAGVTSDVKFVRPFVKSGGHARSLQMLQEDEADFASIDSATFRLLTRHRPELIKGLSVIGRGPVVPATPLHISKTRTASLSEVSEAVCGVFDRTDLQAPLADIGISGFVRLANSDYDGVMDLVKTAEVVLPRR
jgi:ABC-type phosphate/phosphonate transport system substrate-binding protein